MPRTKLVVAMAARGVERARRPARRAGVDRRRAEAIVEAILKVLVLNQLNEAEIDDDEESEQMLAKESGQLKRDKTYETV